MGSSRAYDAIREGRRMRLDEVAPIRDIDRLSPYGAIFFFRNMGRYKKAFIALTIVSIVAAVIEFLSAYAMSVVIDSISIDRLLHYGMIFAGLYAAKELLGFVTRRYGERLPILYVDELRLRFYKTVLASNFHDLLGYSKERLSEIIGKYVDSVGEFLSDWTWGMPRRLTTTIIVLAVLYYQSFWIGLLNTIYLVLFMIGSLKLSKRYAKIAKEHTQAAIDTQSVLSSLVLQLNTLKRIAGGSELFDRVTSEKIENKWAIYDRLKRFHAGRWAIQLSLFNAVYLVTLFWAIYQVATGRLNLGYLLLVSWAYSSLFGTLVYFIEYWVSLEKKRENFVIFRDEIVPLIDLRQTKRLIGNNLLVSGFDVSYANAIPDMVIRQGEHVQIIAPSGYGKTTLMYAILDIIRYDGYISSPLSTNYVSPDCEFVNGISLLDNMNAPLDVVERLASLLGVDFIDDWAQIYGKSDISLSAGEKQRLRLLRCFCQPANVYLLDEPLSGLDKANRDKVLNYVSNLDSTIVIASHEDIPNTRRIEVAR
jgi:ABC-type bacteriocin/lantibiotic exporter with double-glycine peptidase domain